MTINRRTLSPEGYEKLEAMVKGDHILANAFRLMTDAHVLFSHDRYSSVVALAVLCIEEIGKYLLAKWSAADSSFKYHRHKLHIMKQSAIAALFMTDQVRREYRSNGVDFSDLNSPEKMAVLVRALQTGIGKEQSFAGSVRSGVIEVVKHSGIYYDEGRAAQEIEPTKITADNADEMMRLCSRAFMVLTEDTTVALAQKFFVILDWGDLKKPVLQQDAPEQK